jgi:orotate phosphoribosyltransferase
MSQAAIGAAVRDGLPRPPDSLQDREDIAGLRAAILRHSVKFSQSFSKSGRCSPYCLDLRELLYRPHHLKTAAALLWRRIRHLDPDLIGGMTLAAEQLTAGLLQAALAEGREVCGFSVRKEAKTYGLRRRIEGAQPTPGARVVVIDDLFNSGHTVAEVIAALKPFRAQVVGCAALLDFDNESFSRRVGETLPRVRLLSLVDLGLRSAGATPVRRPTWARPILNAGSYTAPHATPLLDQDGVVAASDTGYVMAFDHAGREVWRMRISDHTKGVRTALAGFADSVIFGGYDGFVYRVARSSGAIIWSAHLGAAVGASPAIDAARGIGYFAVNQGQPGQREPGSSYFAIRLTDGHVLWRRSGKDYSFARPALAGETVIVAANNGAVQGLSRGPGERLWLTRLPAQVKGWITADGPRCFAGCFDGYLYALSTITGKVLWRKKLADWLLVHPAAAGGQVVVAATNHLCSLDQNDGAIRWVARIGSRVTGVALDPAQDLCVAASESGLVCGLNLSSGLRLWHYRAKAAIRATPAISRRQCAVPSYDGHLYMFDTSEPTVVCLG